MHAAAAATLPHNAPRVQRSSLLTSVDEETVRLARTKSRPSALTPLPEVSLCTGLPARARNNFTILMQLGAAQNDFLEIR